MTKEYNEVLEALGKVLHDQKKTIAIQKYQIDSLKKKIVELENQDTENEKVEESGAL